MSLLNVWVGKNRALVSVDTDGIMPNGEHHDFSKLITLPHAGAVFAGRGDRVFLESLFQYYYFGTGTFGFDEIVEHLPRAIGKVLEYQQSLPGFSDSGDYQIVIAGWSEKTKRMAGYFAHGLFRVGEAPVVEKLGQRVMPGDPWSDRPQDVPLPNEETNHLILAAVQAKWLREQGTAGGGRLILADLQRNQITLKSLSFSGPEQ